MFNTIRHSVGFLDTGSCLSYDCQTPIRWESFLALHLLSWTKEDSHLHRCTFYTVILFAGCKQFVSHKSAYITFSTNRMDYFVNGMHRFGAGKLHSAMFLMERKQWLCATVHHIMHWICTMNVPQPQHLSEARFLRRSAFNCELNKKFSWVLSRLAVFLSFW